ncbi:hypothetical protein EVAR_26849_1 [Eumeta japonica]|uniref:Uncharacterized protein n=1 Tax=Eumeta variegata TaxID=151549 RepID=A0A4C1VZ11_EUMVA|nr:hypothetical protein EVAR_26849_1 [Eumeta japonica]
MQLIENLIRPLELERACSLSPSAATTRTGSPRWRSASRGATGDHRRRYRRNVRDRQLSAFDVKNSFVDSLREVDEAPGRITSRISEGSDRRCGAGVRPVLRAPAASAGASSAGRDRLDRLQI